MGGWLLPGLLRRMVPPRSVARAVQQEYDYVIVGVRLSRRLQLQPTFKLLYLALLLIKLAPPPPHGTCTLDSWQCPGIARVDPSPHPHHTQTHTHTNTTNTTTHTRLVCTSTFSAL